MCRVIVTRTRVGQEGVDGKKTRGNSLSVVGSTCPDQTSPSRPQDRAFLSEEGLVSTGLESNRGTSGYALRRPPYETFGEEGCPPSPQGREVRPEGRRSLIGPKVSTKGPLPRPVASSSEGEGVETG